jgi:type IV pilus assembly protein PilA
MMNLFRKRMKGDKGFTLIELLVVIIIIAILAAIAIPTFLGQRQKAQDAAAKSLVRNAMTAMESAYVDERTYDVDSTVLTAIEPAITYTELAAAATAPTAECSANAVNYSGTKDSYAIVLCPSPGRSSAHSHQDPGRGETPARPGTTTVVLRPLRQQRDQVADPNCKL